MCSPARNANSPELEVGSCGIGMPAWSTFSDKIDLITIKDQLPWLPGYYGSKEERGKRLPPLVTVCLPGGPRGQMLLENVSQTSECMSGEWVSHLSTECVRMHSFPDVTYNRVCVCRFLKIKYLDSSFTNSEIQSS